MKTFTFVIGKIIDYEPCCGKIIDYEPCCLEIDVRAECATQAINILQARLSALNEADSLRYTTLGICELTARLYIDESSVTKANIIRIQ